METNRSTCDGTVSLLRTVTFLIDETMVAADKRRCLCSDEAMVAIELLSL